MNSKVGEGGENKGRKEEEVEKQTKKRIYIKIRET